MKYTIIAVLAVGMLSFGAVYTAPSASATVLTANESELSTIVGGVCDYKNCYQYPGWEKSLTGSGGLDDWIDHWYSAPQAFTCGLTLWDSQGSSLCGSVITLNIQEVITSGWQCNNFVVADWVLNDKAPSGTGPYIGNSVPCWCQ